MATECVKKPYKLRADKGKKRGTIGPREGSQAHWLSTFKLGETRWIECDMERKYINRPPIPGRRSDGFKFVSLKYCAVPQSSVTLEPAYLWRITRVK